MEIKALEKIGLTQNESKVYTILLKIGLAKTGEILKESGLNSGRIYEILESLKSKGLINESIVNHVKHFSASSPENLLYYVAKKRKALDEEEELVKKMIPEFNALKTYETKQTKTLVYRGMEGFKIMGEDLLRGLEKGDYIHILSITGKKNKKYNAFWKKFNLRTGAKGVKTKILFQEKAVL